MYVTYGNGLFEVSTYLKLKVEGTKVLEVTKVHKVDTVSSPRGGRLTRGTRSRLWRLTCGFPKGYRLNPCRSRIECAGQLD